MNDLMNDLINEIQKLSNKKYLIYYGYISEKWTIFIC